MLLATLHPFIPLYPSSKSLLSSLLMTFSSSHFLPFLSFLFLGMGKLSLSVLLLSFLSSPIFFYSSPLLYKNEIYSANNSAELLLLHFLYLHTLSSLFSSQFEPKNTRIYFYAIWINSSLKLLFILILPFYFFLLIFSVVCPVTFYFFLCVQAFIVAAATLAFFFSNISNFFFNFSHP